MGKGEGKVCVRCGIVVVVAAATASVAAGLLTSSLELLAKLFHLACRNATSRLSRELAHL